MRTRVLWLTYWVTMSMWFGQGCESMNVSNQPRQASSLPALQADTAPMAFSGKPSVTGIDRSEWAAQDVRLSRDDLEVRPTYVRSFLIDKRNRARATGAYPTIETSLDLADNPRTVGSEYLEVILDPGVTLGNLFLAPFRAVFITRPREIQHGAAESYDLLPPTDPIDLSPVTPRQ